jgi:hypothetical protein
LKKCVKYKWKKYLNVSNKGRQNQPAFFYLIQ